MVMTVLSCPLSTFHMFSMKQEEENVLEIFKSFRKDLNVVGLVRRLPSATEFIFYSADAEQCLSATEV